MILPFLPQEENACRIAGVSSEPLRLGLTVQVFFSLCVELGPCNSEIMQVTDEMLIASKRDVNECISKLK